MMKTICALLFFCIVSGCATIQPEYREPIPTVALFAAPKEEIWNLILSEVAINYPIMSMDAENGLLSTGSVDITVGFDNLGMDDWAVRPNVFTTLNGLRMSMNILVTEIDPWACQVSVRTRYEALDIRSYGGWTPCESTGKLEQIILTKIKNGLVK